MTIFEILKLKTPESFAACLDKNFQYDKNHFVTKKANKMPCRNLDHLFKTKKYICTESANFARIWLTKNGYWNQILYFRNKENKNKHHFVCSFKYPGNDNLYVLGNSRAPGEIQGAFKSYKEIPTKIMPDLEFIKPVPVSSIFIIPEK